MVILIFLLKDALGNFWKFLQSFKIYYANSAITCYLKLPYFGIQSQTLKSELVNCVGKFFPCINLKVILVNNFNIKDIFNHKERLPDSCKSSVIYKYSCESCDATYVGSTNTT